MDWRLPVLAVVALVVLAVPTAAVAVDGGGTTATDDLGAVTLSPAEGPNGEYASVEDGNLTVAFEKLNADAVTTADQVFTATATDDRPVRVWLTFEADEGLTAYEGDDPGDRLDGRSNAVVLDPGESIAVGFRVDTLEATPESGTMTVHAEYVDEGAGDSSSTPTAPGEPTPNDSDPGTATPPANGSGPAIEVVSLSASGNGSVDRADIDAPSVAIVGDTVDIEATIENRGTVNGTYTAQLLIDGAIVAERTVPVAAGERVTVTFAHRFDRAGDHTVSLGGHETTVTVLRPDDGEPAPSFAVTDVGVNASEVATGDSVTVVATVENTGDAAGEFEADLTVAGVVVGSKRVAVPAGESRRVRFTHSFDEPGVYDVAVSGVEGGEVVVRSGDQSGRLLNSSIQATVFLPVLLGLVLGYRLQRRRRR